MNRPVRAFLFTFLLCWIGTLSAMLVEGSLLHWPFSDWWPLFSSSAPDDFMIYAGLFRHLHGTAFFVDWKSYFPLIPNFPFTYPAPAAVLFAFFFHFGFHAEAFLIGTFVCGVAIAAACLLHGLLSRGVAGRHAFLLVAASTLLSYPILFAIDRGNMEMMNCLFVWAAVVCMWRSWWKTGAVLLGIAISIKMFPILLVGVPLAQRKYRATVIALLSAAASTLCSLFFVGPTVTSAYKGIASGLSFFTTEYVLQLHKGEIGFDHSLFVQVKEAYAALQVQHPLSGHAYAVLYRDYLLVVGLCGLIFFFTRVRRLPVLNQLVILVALSIFIPPVSADYTLTHLYAPWACLVLGTYAARRTGEPVAGVIPLMVLFAALMAPESFLNIHHLKLSGSIKAMELAAMIVVAAIYPVPGAISVKEGTAICSPEALTPVNKCTVTARNGIL